MVLKIISGRNLTQENNIFLNIYGINVKKMNMNNSHKHFKI